MDSNKQQIELTLTEFKLQALALEKAIGEYVSARVEDFQNKTGVAITAISVPMVDASTFSGPRRYAVGIVSVELDLITRLDRAMIRLEGGARSNNSEALEAGLNAVTEGSKD